MKPESSDRLRKLHEKFPAADPAFEAALTEEGIRRARRFLKGIRSYRHHPVRRDVPEAKVVWQAGTTCLRDYTEGEGTGRPLLVIPSLINRFDILDLDHETSFLRAMAREPGLRPLVVDWNAPGDDEKDFTITDYVFRRLIPILDWINANSVHDQIHVLGYCMGGLLALALAALREPALKTLTLMATPWDFHASDTGLDQSFRTLADEVEPEMRALGYLPVDVIQALFGIFQPLQVVSKFSRFADLDPASREARHFVLLEDWLNEGVPLTAPVARECLRGWYGENSTALLNWDVGTTTIDPRRLTLPTYAIVPGKDRIVPKESALPLVRLLHKPTLHEPMLGHVGLVASRNAPSDVWRPLVQWLKAQNK